MILQALSCVFLWGLGHFSRGLSFDTQDGMRPAELWQGTVGQQAGFTIAFCERCWCTIPAALQNISKAQGKLKAVYRRKRRWREVEMSNLQASQWEVTAVFQNMLRMPQFALDF